MAKSGKLSAAGESFTQAGTKYGKAAMGCGKRHAIGFRDFLLRGNVVDLAVAVVVGAAFTNLVQAFVRDWITPLIGAIFSGGDFSNLTFSINGSTFFYGDFINVLIYFILVCLVVYFFVVVPMNALIRKVNPGYFMKKRPGGCPYCGNLEVPYTASKCGACCSELPPLPSAELEQLEDDEGEEQVKPAGEERI